MYSLLLKPRAIRMMRSSYSWYEKQRIGLGEDFLSEVEKVIKSIHSNPFLFASIQEPYRQALVKRFPYVVVYEVFGFEIIVYSIFHTSRHPSKKIK